ncbi:MAG: beta-glycosidase [Prevotellaceae bacterium]|jgi:glucosylceramidase|nr:beta-glycosidase [Prevotellaceae bacterium]
MMKKTLLSLGVLTILAPAMWAQSFVWVSSTAGSTWKQSSVALQKKAATTPALEISGNENLLIFKRWGTCFNELGWHALNILPDEEREALLEQIFSLEGELRFSMGRIPMNANDYAHDWYSCDEVSGDFQLKYFSIDHDRQAIIPFIKSAQKYNPSMTFWISPWSPPAWMKINHYYSCRSSEKYNTMSPLSDVALFEDSKETDSRYFPQQLAVNDYFIQDPRYLQAYAHYFCKFIDAYKAENIPITMAMYQNEAYSYTVYPGCAWTPEGTIRFNVEYLAPALKQHHPDVALYLGTVNTNRFDIIDRILSDPRMPQSIQGVGFQWEGGQILPRIREKYPHYKYVQTESECGWGSFDWKAAEHTFGLINHYLSNGCDEYTFWNVILCDQGMSAWGWKQNALIRVNSTEKTATLTPEYYAVRHYTQYVASGARLLGYRDAKENNTPVLVFATPQGKYVVIAGNFNDERKDLSVKLGNRYLNVRLQPHSLNTFQNVSAN